VGYVLDAAAVIARFRHEPGWEAVAPHLEGALLSTVNMGEVFTYIKNKPNARMTPDALMRDLIEMGVVIEPLSVETAYRQSLVPNIVTYEEDGRAKKQRLGWGDRVAVALAHERNRTLLTSDHILALLGEPYSFEVFRK
jgi:ribonuclease VapC